MTLHIPVWLIYIAMAPIILFSLMCTFLGFMYVVGERGWFK